MKMDMPDALSPAEALSTAVRMGVLGEWPRVLCVCSAAVNRSPTLAWLLSRPPYNCTTIAAGSHTYKAIVPISQVLLDWAQIAVFANPENKARVLEDGLHLPAKTYTLQLPDSYSYRDHELVSIIHEELRHAIFRA